MKRSYYDISRIQDRAKEQAKTVLAESLFNSAADHKAFVKGFMDFALGRKRAGRSSLYNQGWEQAKKSMLANPMDFYCAPNQATPDYVSYSDIRQFVAYGMMTCHYDLQDIEGYTPDADDYYWLRKYFLDAVETALEFYPKMEWNKPCDVDVQDSLYLMSNEDRAKRQANPDFNDDPEDECVFTWRPEMVGDDGDMCISLDWFFTGHSEADSTAIWAAAEVMTGHKREWKSVIAEARKLNERLH